MIVRVGVDFMNENKDIDGKTKDILVDGTTVWLFKLNPEYKQGQVGAKKYLAYIETHSTMQYDAKMITNKYFFVFNRSDSLSSF